MKNVKKKVMEMLVDETLKKGHDICHIVKSPSTAKVLKYGIVHSDGKLDVSLESAHAFFSNIPTKEQLTRVISLISETTPAGKKTAQSKESTAKRVWEMYKHDDKSRKKKEDARVQGNHVRNVFAPLAKNLRRLEEKMDGQIIDKIDKMEKEITEISKKMDQFLKKFESSS